MALGKFLKERWIIILIIIAFILAGYGIAKAFFIGEKAVEYDTSTVIRGDIVQTVDATGVVKAEAEINLSFESSGKLASTTVAVGDIVMKGDVLAELDNETLKYQVDEAQAALDRAVANYNLELAGEPTASINVSEADVKQAEAALRSADVALAQAKRDYDNAGVTTQDQIEEAELALIAAENTLVIRQSEYDNIMNQTDANIDDAYESAVVILQSSLSTMSTSIDDMDKILGIDDKTANADFEKYLGVLDDQTLVDAEISYKAARDAKNVAYTQINSLTTSSSHSAIRSAIITAEDALIKINKGLVDTRRVLDASITGTYLTKEELESKKAIIDTDLAAVNSKLTSLLNQKQVIDNLETTNNISKQSAELALTAAEDAYNQALKNLESINNSVNTSLDSYEAAVATAQSNRDIKYAALESSKAALALKKSGPRGVDLAPLEAQVKSAEATYNMAVKRLENSQIIAPENGLIIQVNYEVGEQVASVASTSGGAIASGVITMLATDIFEVEVDIPETDIVKISVNDPSEITLDAFGDEVIFMGEVIEIEPAETVVQDVVYYKVKVKIDFTSEQAVRSGMTANVVILTDTRQNVLVVPQRSIITKDGKKIIRVLKGREVEEREPVIGLRGDDGLTEIISGVEEGEEVVTAVREVQ